MIRQNLLLVAAGLLVALTGIVHGLWTDRWQAMPEVAEAVARLDQIPREVGDWRGIDLELSPGEIKTAQIAGYCYRRYEHVRNRHGVMMLLVCGRPGPISVHTPDVCFEGAGYQKVSAPVGFTLPYGTSDRKGNFWTMGMRQKAVPSTGLRVFWAWTAGGPWQAPDYPRLTFARHRTLFKLYVLRGTTDEDIRVEEDPCAELMRALLPALDRALLEGL
jgi:Protein of unknown function (DUF3485)